MRRLEARPLDGFNEAVIDRPAVFEVELPDGRLLDYETLINNTPAVTSGYDGYTNPQLVLTADTELPGWDESTYYPVGRLDKIHGRTLEVLASRVEVVDEFDNVYGSLNVKGCDFSDPHLFKTLTAAREYIIYGLQESLVMERVIRASRVLRENGVDTEYICGLVLPETFPLNRAEPGVDDKELKGLPKFLEHLAGVFATRAVTDEDATLLEIKADMIDRFKDCDYLITYRAIDCPLRLGELHDPGKYRQLQSFMDSHCKNKDNEVAKYIREHDAEDCISTVLAHWLGGNIAKMHKAGIYHKHPVRLNVSALGSIIDLDSCEGESLGLGDRPINRQDETRDVFIAIRALQEELDLIPRDESDPYSHLNTVTKQHNAAHYFLQNYLENRFENRKDRVQFLADFIRHTDKEAKKEDGMVVYRMVEQAYGVYRSLSRAHVPASGLEIYDSISAPTLKRSESFSSSLPPQLFSDMKDMILDPDWTMNDAYGEKLAGEKRPVYNPIKALVKNLTLEHIIANYPADGYETAEDLLFLAGAALERVTPRSPERKAAVEQARQFFNTQVELVIDRLAEVDPDAVGQELRPLLDGKLKGFEGRIGSIDITGEGEPPVDILYLTNEAEYEEVLRSIGIDDQAQMEILSPTIVNAFINGDKRLLFPDSVLVADYQVARWNSEQDTFDNVLSSLFGYRKSTLPLLMVRGISSGSPEVFVYPTLYRENGPQPFNFAEFLEALSAPSAIPGYDQLFVPDEEPLDSTDA